MNFVIFYLAMPKDWPAPTNGLDEACLASSSEALLISFECRPHLGCLDYLYDQILKEKRIDSAKTIK